MKCAIIDYKCVDGFKFEVNLNKTQILFDHHDLKERGVFDCQCFFGKLPMAIKSIIPLKILESITFGNCSRNTNPSWTFLSNDSENIAISFFADDCGFIVETEPNLIYQSTLFIPNSGKFFNRSF